MYRDQWQRLLGLFKRALRTKRRLNISELALLADAISGYGRMIQAHEKWNGPPPQFVIVEVAELAYRFRENEQAIQDALVLLRTEGRAETLRQHGHWKLKLADALSGRANVEVA